MSTLSHPQIIDLLKALADPNRLHLFELLLRSDRTNSELMEKTGLRQNLLSHHLNILCMSGLVRAQQSIGDARRHYYSVDLRITRAFGAWWECQTPPDDLSLSALKQPRRVLFLCLRNASRSLIAEAVARHMAPHALIVYSAGLEEPGLPLPEVTLQVLAEHRISIENLAAKRYDELLETTFDYLITVCDVVHESLIPNELSYKEYIHWSLHDPVEGIDDPAEQLRLARELYDEIVLRLSHLLQCLVREQA